MSNTEIATRRTDAISRGVGVTTQIYADKALNAELWDVEGNRYIDFAAGIAVVNTGHRHPKVIAAVKDQLDHFTHTCHQVVPYENYVRLAERLNDAVPGDFKKKTIFVTTGAEAVENAIKIARAATNRSAIIAFSGALDQRTLVDLLNAGSDGACDKSSLADLPKVMTIIQRYIETLITSQNNRRRGSIRESMRAVCELIKEWNQRLDIEEARHAPQR